MGSMALVIGQHEGHHETGGVCDIAPDQSPINILSSQAIHDEEQCDSELDWYINRHHSSFLIKDTCQKNHTVQVIATNEDGNLISHARESIAVLNTDHLPEVIRKHESYCLDQFHIHWGSVDSEGSEHQINGHASALEMHFVHYACEYDTFAAAQAEGAATGGSGSADHTLAVVALFFELSEYDNPAFDLILEHVGGECKDTHGGEVCEHQLLQFLLPTGWQTGGYFAYQGGLTTTPCTDDVNWILLNTKAAISSNQLEQLRALKHPFTGEEITANFREIVENDKPVYTCMDGDIDEEFEEVSGLSFDVDTDGDIATLITDDHTTSSTSSSSSASSDEDTSYESIQSERELIFEMLTGMRANGNSESMIRRLQSSSSSSSSFSESSDDSKARRLQSASADSASSSSVSSVEESVVETTKLNMYSMELGEAETGSYCEVLKMLYGDDANC